MMNRVLTLAAALALCAPLARAADEKKPAPGASQQAQPTAPEGGSEKPKTVNPPAKTQVPEAPDAKARRDNAAAIESQKSALDKDLERRVREREEEYKQETEFEEAAFKARQDLRKEIKDLRLASERKAVERQKAFLDDTKNKPPKEIEAARKRLQKELDAEQKRLDRELTKRQDALMDKERAERDARNAQRRKSGSAKPAAGQCENPPCP